MKRLPVDSSMINSIGYDKQQKILEVEFNSGKIWHYVNVSNQVYSKFIKAKSAGRYFLDSIKDCYEEYQIR